MPDFPILVINTGSSSLKFGLYDGGNGAERLVFDGLVESIGRSNGKIELKDSGGGVVRSEKLILHSFREALKHAARWLAELSPAKPRIIGHRLVHGGPRLLSHQTITPDVIRELRACLHFAPLHIPIALELIEEAERSYPDTPQFACFDTAFHRTLPEAASRLPLPRDLFDEGIRRYGFHGLSYESIVDQLGRDLPSRTVVAHLGSGASLAALRDGRSIDTTMGLTPSGGIPMATRSGDLDPGVLLYLMRAKKMDADSLESLLNHDSGLLAISGGRSDMRDLEAAADAGDQAPQLAIEIFCTSISKVIAAYAAVLGGLDMLVFSGGIGEHSARVRREVCCRLGFLGISVDNGTSTGRVRVAVVASQEDRRIAHHCRVEAFK